MSRPKSRRRLAGLDIWSTQAEKTFTVTEQEDRELIAHALTMAERALGAGDVDTADELTSLSESLAEHLRGAK